MKRAKPKGKPVDIHAGYKRVMKRFPVIMAVLALGACQTRYVTVQCISPEQLEQQRQAEPPKVSDKLTGKADEDVKTIAGSAIRLRAWGRGMLGILEGCTSPPA